MSSLQPLSVLKKFIRDILCMVTMEINWTNCRIFHRVWYLKHMTLEYEIWNMFYLSSLRQRTKFAWVLLLTIFISKVSNGQLQTMKLQLRKGSLLSFLQNLSVICDKFEWKTDKNNLKVFASLFASVEAKFSVFLSKFQKCSLKSLHPIVQSKQNRQVSHVLKQ